MKECSRQEGKRGDTNTQWKQVSSPSPVSSSKPPGQSTGNANATCRVCPFACVVMLPRPRHKPLRSSMLSHHPGARASSGAKQEASLTRSPHSINHSCWALISLRAAAANGRGWGSRRSFHAPGLPFTVAEGLEPGLYFDDFPRKGVPPAKSSSLHRGYSYDEIVHLGVWSLFVLRCTNVFWNKSSIHVRRIDTYSKKAS
jgi:hypothetical protein